MANLISFNNKWLINVDQAFSERGTCYILSPLLYCNVCIRGALSQILKLKLCFIIWNRKG